MIVRWLPAICPYQAVCMCSTSAVALGNCSISAHKGDWLTLYKLVYWNTVCLEGWIAGRGYVDSAEVPASLLTPSVSRSSFNVSCHVLLGLPTLLLPPSGLHIMVRLAGLVVRSRRMCPTNRLRQVAILCHAVQLVQFVPSLRHLWCASILVLCIFGLAGSDAWSQWYSLKSIFRTFDIWA